MLADGDSEFERLVARVREGDQEASEALFLRFARQLARLAEGQLSQRVARRVDGSDIVQSVFRSFFARVERGEFQIHNSAALWKLLVKITINKSRQQGRRNTAEQRDSRRETTDSDILTALLAEQPGPADAVILGDLIEGALLKLPDAQRPHYRRLIELQLADHSTPEIATDLGVSRRTVERMFVRLQGVFEPLNAR